jgi:uncharacterized membrane protein YidH (DUF202 family)
MNASGGGPDDDPVTEDREAFGAGARTDLAWNRIGLALAVAAASVLKLLIDIDNDSARAVITAVIGALLVGWGLSIAYGRYVTRGSLEGELHADQRRLRTVARATTLFAIAALLIAAVPSR